MALVIASTGVVVVRCIMHAFVVLFLRRLCEAVAMEVESAPLIAETPSRITALRLRCTHFYKTHTRTIIVTISAAVFVLAIVIAVVVALAARHDLSPAEVWRCACCRALSLFPSPFVP